MEWENRLAIDLQSVQAYNHGISVHRQQEASKIEQYLEDYQWVTVLGLSGLGKTHLTWQIASKWCKVHHWSMYFCDVTDCETPAKLVQILSETLQIKHVQKNALDSIVRKLNGDHFSIFNTIEAIFNRRHQNIFHLTLVLF